MQDSARTALEMRWNRPEISWDNPFDNLPLSEYEIRQEMGCYHREKF